MTDERCIHITDGQMCGHEVHSHSDDTELSIGYCDECFEPWRTKPFDEYGRCLFPRWIQHAYEPGIPCPTCGGSGVVKSGPVSGKGLTASYPTKPCPANCIQGWVDNSPQ